MTVAEVLGQAAASLSRSSISSAQIDAELLLGYTWEKSREWLMAHPEDLVPDSVNDQFSHLIKRRTDREPLVHLTGAREFYGLEIEITPDVLSPRVETEQMVEWAIQYAPKNSKLIDIGTGSGAIAIAVAKNRTDLDVWATDVTPESLLVAKRNAAKHKLSIKFVQSDLWGAFSVIPDRKKRSDVPDPGSRKLDAESLSGMAFNTALTNLPYLKNDAELMPEVKREPASALFGGDDGLDIYRRFLRALPKHLGTGGYLFTECDPWQQDDLIKEAKAVGLKPIERGYFILGFKRS